MSGIIYDPRIAITVENLAEHGYSRIEPVSLSHKTPLTCGTIFTGTPPCKNGEMWIFRRGPDLTVSKPESDRLLCMTCGKQERAR